MRWFLIVALFLSLGGAVLASGPDDQYLDIYNEVLQADSLQQNGQIPAAAAKYAEAQARLRQFKTVNPGWYPDVVGFRLQYLTDKLQESATVAQPIKAPATPAPAPVAVPVAPPVAVPVVAPATQPSPALEQQISGLQEQVRALTAANGELENKLKEALSIQPSAVSPVELSKREEEIVALKKERDLLTVALDQAKAEGTANSAASNSKLTADLAAAQHEASEANKKLEAHDRELSALKAAAANQLAPADAARLTQERDRLKQELADRTKDLADSEAHRDQDVLAAHTQLKDAVAQRDELQKKLYAASSAAAPAAADTAEIERLRARVAVLESQAVPYTPEELAILHQPPSQPLNPPKPIAKRPHVAHTNMELPPGAGGLMRDATRATMERDFAQAEAKYKEILRQDENNVYVLPFLADAQFAQGHLEDCEKTVDRAIALDPDDPATLFSLGILRYRQEKLDEAQDALSRSAQLNGTNAATQNFLGCVLTDKGLRPQAETAFRKALQLEPDYRDAHYNLALIYISEKPSSPELARWHYKRAVDLGHPKNPNLEAILDAAK